MKNFFNFSFILLVASTLIACSAQDAKLAETSSQISGKWVTDCSEVAPYSRKSIEIVNSTNEEGSLLMRSFGFQTPQCVGQSSFNIEQYTYKLENNDGVGTLKIQNVGKNLNQIIEATYQIQVDAKFLTLKLIKGTILTNEGIKPLNETVPQVYHK